MPGVPFCDLNDAFSSEWEKKNNQQYLAKTFSQANACNARNNQFQNEIAKSQFGLPVNPLNRQQKFVQDQTPGPGPEVASTTIIEAQQQAQAQGQVKQIPLIQQFQQLNGQNGQNGQRQLAASSSCQITGPQRSNIDNVPITTYQTEQRIPQNYQVYQTYQQPLPSQWGMNNQVQQSKSQQGQQGQQGHMRNLDGQVEYFGNTDNYMQNYMQNIPNYMQNYVPNYMQNYVPNYIQNYMPSMPSVPTYFRRNREHFGPYGYGYGGGYDKLEHTNNLLTILIFILCLIFIMQVMDILRN